MGLFRRAAPAGLVVPGDLRDRADITDNVLVGRRDLVHYDPAVSSGGKFAAHPSNFDEWMDLGVRVELARFADAAAHRQRRPYDVSRFGLDTLALGLLTNSGANLLWRLLTGASDPGAGNGSEAMPRHLTFTNANARIIVGTSTTAANARQRDLLGAASTTGRWGKGMIANTQIGTVAVPADAANFPLLTGPQDGTIVNTTTTGSHTGSVTTLNVTSAASFDAAGVAILTDSTTAVGTDPVTPVFFTYTSKTGTTLVGPSQALGGTFAAGSRVEQGVFYYDATGAQTNVTHQRAIFRSVFLSGEADSAGGFSWQEFGVDNGNGGTALGANAAIDIANHILFDRIVSNQGTKVTGQVWEPTITLSIA